MLIWARLYRKFIWIRAHIVFKDSFEEQPQNSDLLEVRKVKGIEQDARWTADGRNSS